MAVAAEPQVVLATLPRADGSATYSHGGYTITASVNGPIEAQRRDEDPDEACIDVVVRPAAGVGGPSERHLESVLQKTLQEIVLVHEFPRCLIQVVLQVQSAPEDDYVNTRLNIPGLNLGILPALLQSAVLALLSASLPMRTTATAASFAIVPVAPAAAGAKSQPTSRIVSSFSPRDAAVARSTHVLAFSAQDGELLLAESEGAFTMGEWDAVLAAARAICCQEGQEGQHPRAPDDGMALDNSGSGSGSGSSSSRHNDAGGADGPDLRGLLRSTIQGKLEDALQWKSARRE